MAVVTITWEFTEEEKDGSPFAIDGSVWSDLTHMNEMAILFGKAATNFFEQGIETKIYPEGHNVFFSSRLLGPQKIEEELKEYKVH